LKLDQIFRSPHTSSLKSSIKNSPNFIPILKGVQGFYVDVIIPSKNDNDHRLSKIEYTKSMMIFLYISETLLPETCESFIQYNCDILDCQKYTDQNITSTFPYFYAKGYQAKANITLGTFWQLKTKAIRSISCYEGLLFSYGQGTYGALGLGVLGGGGGNFRERYPLFSVYMNQDGTGGELWPSKNLDRSKSVVPVAKINCLGNWHIIGVEDIQVAGVSVEFNRTETSIIMDMNKDTLGFPSYFFKRVLNVLQKSKIPIKCPTIPSTNYYQPNCTFYGYLNKLPNISFTIQGQTITIPLLNYVDNPESYHPTRGFIIFNINAHNYTVGKIPGTFVTKDYENSIILDRHFMALYYTVFNASGPFIEFHLAKHDQPDDNHTDPMKAFIILMGAVVLILILSSICYLKCRSCKRDREQKNNPQVENLLQAEVQRQNPQNQNSHPFGSGMNDTEVLGTLNQRSQFHQLDSREHRIPQVGDHISHLGTLTQ